VSGAIYVLCFGGRRYHHAGHYVGWAADGDAQRRLQEHLSGKGSPLVRAVVAAGLPVDLVLSRPGTRVDERRLHNRHGTRVCPRCAPARRRRAGQQLRLFRVRSGGRLAPTPRRLAA
jgi:hypothetical protein